MGKVDPRLTQLADILDEHDAWVASRGGTDPTAGAERIANRIIDFLVQSGLNGPFDHLTQDAMRGGFDNEPPPEDDEAACERAILRGKAQLLKFVVRLVPEAFPPKLAAALINDALTTAGGEQPMLGRNIPFANRQQSRPTAAQNIRGRAILWAYYHAARDNVPGGWNALFRQKFGLYTEKTLEDYKKLTPTEDRNLSRAAGKARAQGLSLTPAQEELEARILRVPLKDLQDQLALAVRANIWRDIPR